MSSRSSQLDEENRIYFSNVAHEEEFSETTSEFRNRQGRFGNERGAIPLKCQQCKINFGKRGEFETHLLSHIRVPIISVKRLSDLYISRVIAAASESIKKEAKNCVARKRTQIYAIQKNLMYEPLKLTLKLTDNRGQGRLSSVTAPKKVLIGPGDCAVKKEENCEQERGRVGGPVYNKDRVEDDEKTSGPEQALCEQDSDSESGDENGQAVLPGASKATLETLETLRRLGVVRLPGPRKRSSSIVSSAPPTAPPSPTPSELLGPEFLAPERPSCPPTPVMVEKNLDDDERSCSPAFNSKESNSPESSDENSDADDQQEGNTASLSSKQKIDEDSNESNYSWNDGNSYDEGVGNEASEDVEERDPLFLPEQSPDDGEGANINENSVSGYESLSARGDDSQSDKEMKPKNLPSAESLGLSTEYISLERLGDASNSCSVCNEKFPDRLSLSNHRAQAGHFQCGHAGCGIVCGSIDELKVHQEVSHCQGGADMKPSPAKHPPTPTHQVPHIHPKPLSNLVQQPPSPRAPCPSSLPIHQAGLQKRPAPSNGDTSPSHKQRRLDMLLPDQHDDADCHVIALQKRTESGPVIGNVEGLVNSPESMIQLSDSITLSVRQPSNNNASSTPPASGSKGKSDPKAVANILATRGITVVPSGGGTNRGQLSPQRQLQTAQRPTVQQSPATTSSVAALNLNSAISIIPAASTQQPVARQTMQNNASGNFAVPQGRSPMSRQQQQQQQPQQLMERPPRPPTVDLTQDTPVPARRTMQQPPMQQPPMQQPSMQQPPMQQPPAPQFMSRGRARGRPVMSRHTCQICSKVFSTPENLTAHMALHRSPGKLPFRCSNCPAQYPTQHGLLLHQQSCRRDPPRQQSNMMPQIVEMAVPLINMKIPGLMNRLRSLGVTNYISYSQFINMPGNHVGLPIVTVDGSRLPALNNITQIGATAVISFGPIKPLPR